MRRAYVAMAALGLAAGVLLFGSRLPGLTDPPDTVGTTTSTTIGLTAAERAWCEGDPGRVAGVAHWEYQDQGAPALRESERLAGELQPSTLERFISWASDHPALYDQACGEAFGVWAGWESDPTDSDSTG